MVNSNYNLSFHHMGLGVRDPKHAKIFLQSSGYQVGDVMTDNLQNVNLIWCSHSKMPSVEIVFPTASAGPLELILQKSNSWIYHLCYETADRNLCLEKMEADGLKVSEISKPTPAVLFNGRLVSFHYVSGFGIIELLDPKI